jgi:hypothetical protein
MTDDALFLRDVRLEASLTPLTEVPKRIVEINAQLLLLESMRDDHVLHRDKAKVELSHSLWLSPRRHEGDAAGHFGIANATGLAENTTDLTHLLPCTRGFILCLHEPRSHCPRA